MDQTTKHSFPPLTALRGISTRREALLKKLDVHTSQDLLFFYPRSYDDWTELTAIDALQAGDYYTVKGHLQSPLQNRRRGRLSWQQGYLIQAARRIEVLWFNQPWLCTQIKANEEYVFRGLVKEKQGRLQLLSPRHVSLAAHQRMGLVPIYRLTKGLTQKVIHQAVREVLDHLDPTQVNDPIPEDLRKRQQLAALSFALEQIHFPKSQAALDMARKRLAFEELFLTQAAMRLLREERARFGEAKAVQTTEAARQSLEAIREALPFTPTKAQLRASNDIFRDLRKTRPMNRLLQGDVGSGKTLVAALAMAYVAACGGQSIFMAPTTILAEQHAASLRELLAAETPEMALLTGATKAKERRAIEAACADGTVKILLGTHALLHAQFPFKALHLVVTDEQHRFGVKQRQELQAQEHPEEREVHRLVMSATPIPRTLGLILYGDLDISVIDEMPKGRQPVLTYKCQARDRRRVDALLQREMHAGAQIYVVCPVIESSETLEVASAEEVYEEMRTSRFPGAKIGLLHGQMPAKDKEAMMRAFYAQEISILVSTTVVEVGVDQANASVMLIHNAERFGLAQLHQLRGRVGRGSRQSYCLLETESQDPLVQERLGVLCRYHDGFQIAEEDLRLRGPGDFFGTRQHGLPEFKLLNLYEDIHLMEDVRLALAAIYDEEGAWQAKARREILESISQRYPSLAIQSIL